MTTATQKITDPKRDIRALIQSDNVKSQMAMVLPKHLTAERMARVACTAVMRTPKLLQSTQESLLSCLMQCSQLGLEPDGRRAHLIPFENKKKGTVECTLIVDWKGLAELALRSGMIAKLHADTICQADEFDFDMGDILHHRIDFKKSRGEPYAAYAMAVTKTGEKFVAVMQKDEIEKIRDGSQGWKAFKAGYTYSSPWQDAPFEMWKKTAFRRLAKWLPLSPEFRDAIDVDDEETPIIKSPVETSRPIFGALPAIIAPESERSKQDDDQIPGAEIQPKAESGTTTINYVKGLRGLLNLSQILESDFLDFMRVTHEWDDSLASLEEVATVSPSKLTAAYEGWPAISAEIKRVNKQ